MCNTQAGWLDRRRSSEERRANCPHNRETHSCKHCKASICGTTAKYSYMQAMRRVEHLRTQLPKKQVQAMWRGKHLRLTLRAQPHKEGVKELQFATGFNQNETNEAFDSSLPQHCLFLTFPFLFRHQHHPRAFPPALSHLHFEPSCQ